MEAAISDGAVIVNILKPYNCQTFADYALNVFIPYLSKQLQDVESLDIVWDMYLADSLKNSASTKRGQGDRRKVSEKGKLPSNWQTFLRCDELFSLLAHCVEKMSTGDKLVVITCEDTV